jgi:HAD superfamily hydrolase (TIGR01549 family)
MAPEARKGVFFDLGGTLVTADPSVADRILQTLADLGHPTDHHDVATALKVLSPQFEEPKNLGWSLTHERSYAFWTSFYWDLLEELGIARAERGALVSHIYGKLSKPQGYALYADVIPVLERLAGEGYSLGLISNWETWGEELVKYLGIDHYFPIQVISGCVGVEKPDTEIYALALAQTEISPAHVLFVGDSVPLDIEPSMAVGMQAVLIDRHAERDNPQPNAIRTLRELHDHEFFQV